MNDSDDGDARCEVERFESKVWANDETATAAWSESSVQKTGETEDYSKS